MWRLKYQSNKRESESFYCDEHKPGEDITKSYLYNLYSHTQDPQFVCSHESCSIKHTLEDLYHDNVDCCKGELMTIDEEIENFEGKIETLKILKLNESELAKIESLAEETTMELAKSVYEISVRQEQIDRLLEEINSIEDVKTEQMEGLEQIMKRISSVDAKSKELEKKLKS